MWVLGHLWIPAYAGMTVCYAKVSIERGYEIPAYAGMTVREGRAIAAPRGRGDGGLQ